MPLHRDEPGMARQLNCLDGAVIRMGGDLEWLSGPADCLVMPGDDFAFDLPQHGRKPRVRLRADGMARCLSLRLAMGDPFSNRVRHMLNERSTQRDVDHLAATANSQGR